MFLKMAFSTLCSDFVVAENIKSWYDQLFLE